MKTLDLEDKLHEECGVIGVYHNERDAAPLVYYGLYALQHRGQESAGIAANNGGNIALRKKLGLVSEVFHGSHTLSGLNGNIAIGHVRYSTAGDGDVRSAQPLVARCRGGAGSELVDVALAHNGNLVNADSIQEMLTDTGVIFQTTSDSESILNLICQHGNKRGIEAGIHTAMSLMKGAYVLVLTTGDSLIGVRDPNGFHPLCIGKLSDGGWVLASESCALEALDAEFVRDVNPGEIIIINKDGLRSVEPSLWRRRSLCVFELVYFARPDSVVDGVSVYDFRRRCGALLAKQNPIEADMVMAVPDSGIPAAIGYAEASGIPYGEGLIKNKYIGRTFIQPTQEMREDAVRIKLSTIRHNIEGKRVVVIDDSIVRGTTCRRIVGHLRDAGAREVHFCAASPEVRYSCYFGIDTPYREKLIAVQKSQEEIREYMGADSLTFLSMENLMKVCGGQDVTAPCQAWGCAALGVDDGQDLYCRACFDGNYPMEVPATARPTGFAKEGRS
ncbi:MAG: amidophosphoribosyltransferase [Synergistaceae bacterium]|nr:amidophosphoribosyltransferase [Synergistaceae bacterium]